MSLPSVLAVTAAILLLVAAGIHLTLTPEHFGERVLYGLFFLLAAGVQLALAIALVVRPSVWVCRAGIVSSAGLLATWIATRALAPPLSDGPEPVTFAGVVASSAELAALLLLALGLPVGSDRIHEQPRLAWWWAIGAGLSFVSLFLFATGSLARVPADLSELAAVPSASVDWSGGWTFRSPVLTVVLTDHLLLSGPWTTVAFLSLAGVLVALNAGAIVGLARCSVACRLQAGGILAAVPAFVAAPACCGAGVPLGFVLAGGASLSLVSATPWLLLATTVLLAGNLALLRSRWKRALGPSPDRR